LIGAKQAEADACVHASGRGAGWRLSTADRTPALAGFGGRPGTVARRATIAMRSIGNVWTVERAHAWLIALGVGSALMLALGFVHPAAARNPSLRATVETAITLCALTGLWLLRGQFADSRRLRDLLLFGGLLALALLHVCSYALPAMLNLQAGGTFAASVLCGNVFVAATFAAAALVAPERLVRPGADPRILAAGLGVLAVGVAELGGLLLRHRLVATATAPVRGIDNALQHPLGVVLIVVAGGLFATAAVAFARRAHASQPRIVTLLAGASILLAGAGLYSLALPALPPGWITPGLGLRLFAWVLVFAAVVGQELDARVRLAHAAVSAERRRVAQNLHDGLAQDLAFITAHGTLLADQFGAEHPLTVAASRALAVSRGAITELSDTSAGTVQEALESVAHELRHRFDIGVALDARLDTELAPEMREHVVRIAREAIANAARHGEAERVSVSLTRSDDGVLLRVRDDGCGIAHAASAGTREGFGLRSMRERAAARGGHLILSQPADGGTELEVLLH